MQTIVKILAVACVFQAVLAVPFKSELDESKLDVVQQKLVEDENNLINNLEEKQELEDDLRAKKSLYQVPKSYVPKSYSVAAPVQAYQATAPAPAPTAYQAAVSYQPAPASYQVASYAAPSPASSAAYSAPAAASAVYQQAPTAQVVSYQAAAAPATTYAAPAPAYAAPAPTYAAPAYAAPAPQVTYTTYTAQPPCPTNYLFGCQPSVAPVPCSQAYQPPQVQLTPYVAPQAPVVYQQPAYKKPSGGYRAADEEREDMVKNMN